ncbi:MAG: response regulator [Verrucomicrobiota bacterium]
MKNTRILIAQDELIVAADIEARLARMGYTIAGITDNGPAAVELAGSCQPTVVLMDIRLKGPMDGIAAAEEIRKRYDLPVIFLTACAEDSTLQRANSAAPLGYILKPFEDRELRTGIEIGLYKHKAEMEIRRLNQLFAALSQINETLLRARSRDQLFAEICRITAVTAGFRLAWIGWLNPATAGITPVARAGESTEYLDQLNVSAEDVPIGRGPVGISIRTGEPCVSNDFLTDPRAESFRDAASRFRLRSAVSLPLRFQGNICGVLVVYGEEPGAFQEREVGLLAKAAADVSFALDLLKQEEQVRKLARAVECSPASIIITDAAGNIEYVNPKFTQVTGYPAEEVLGRNPRLLKSGEMEPDHYRHMWETITAGREWQGEFHNRRKNGTLYWEMSSISPLRNARGEITHFVAVREDLTEKKLLESKFLRAQRLEGIGSLASGIAHDLNNILAPILMSAPLLQLDEDPASRKELARTIESSAERGASIVKQLLSFARGTEGRREPVQIRHLLRDMAKIARETFPRTIQVEETCGANLWPVPAEVSQLHQVLLNLCVNARDAMPNGGTLTLQAENVELDEHFASMRKDTAPGPYVRIRVTDTGTGIPDSAREHIFESFFTTKGEGHGTGLGLTTVLGIVNQLKGFISFTSSTGKGTTFEIHLPATTKDSPADSSPASTPHIPKGNGEWVLVVDDEPAIRDATQRTLERNGYKVIPAQDGIEALGLFVTRRHQVRAVITDFMMPLMDGITLCRALRAVSPELPVIVSSGGLLGKAGAEAHYAFQQLGISHILHKPHNAEILLQALGEAVRTTQSAAPNYE